MLLLGLLGDTFSVNFLASKLGFSLQLVVSTDALTESLTALTLSHVLRSDVQALGDNAVSHALVDDDTERMLGDIEDAASLSMVEFVGHALGDGTVGDDVNVVSLLVGNEVP